MRTLALLGLAAGIVCGTTTMTTSANAGLAFLSRTGSGTACTLTTPCKDMNTAITAAGAGGNVVCLDRSDYSGSDFVNINASIKISCGDGLWQGYGTALRINPPANSSVLIEGFVSDGDSTINSIEYTGQGTLELSRVRVSSNAMRNGVNFAPTGPAKLFVTDSDFYNLATGGIFAGILIRPASGVTANVTIERSRFENNRFGIVADGNPGGIIRGVVRDSVIAGNGNNGITVTTTGSNVVLTVDNSTISGNNFGLVATGANAGMLVRRSVINANTTGLNTGSGGVLLSYGDNSVNGNNAGETFSGPVGLK